MLFSDYFVLSIDLQGAQLLRCRRGFSLLGIRPEVVQKWAAALEHHSAQNAPSTHAHAWSASLSAAKSLLQQMPAKAALKVVLSNQLIRYKVLPAFPPMTSADEALEMAKQSLFDVFGDLVEQWRIVVNPLPHGDSVMVCAVDEALLVAIEGCVASENIKLTSVQPYLMAGFNALHTHIHSAYACFLQVEAGRITLAMLADKSWLNVSSQLAQPNIEEQIVGLMKREMVLASWPEQAIPSIYLTTLQSNVHFSPTRLSELVRLQGWTLEWVKLSLPKGSLPEQDHVYALAIEGVLP